MKSSKTRFDKALLGVIHPLPKLEVPKHSIEELDDLVIVAQPLTIFAKDEMRPQTTVIPSKPPPPKPKKKKKKRFPMDKDSLIPLKGSILLTMPEMIVQRSISPKTSTVVRHPGFREPPKNNHTLKIHQKGLDNKIEKEREFDQDNNLENFLSGDQYIEAKSEIEQLRTSQKGLLFKEKLVTLILDELNGELTEETLEKFCFHKNLEKEKEITAVQVFICELKQADFNQQGIISSDVLVAALRALPPGTNISSYLERLRAAIASSPEGTLTVQDLEQELHEQLQCLEVQKAYTAALIDGFHFSANEDVTLYLRSTLNQLHHEIEVVLREMQRVKYAITHGLSVREEPSECYEENFEDREENFEDHEEDFEDHEEDFENHEEDFENHEENFEECKELKPTFVESGFFETVLKKPEPSQPPVSTTDFPLFRSIERTYQVESKTTSLHARLLELQRSPSNQHSFTKIPEQLPTQGLHQSKRIENVIEEEDVLEAIEQTAVDLKKGDLKPFKFKYAGSTTEWAHAEPPVTEIGNYETILTALREQELEILNAKRAQLYEEHRPPKEKWYTLKSSKFSSEMHRNTQLFAAKHNAFTKALGDPHLY